MNKCKECNDLKNILDYMMKIKELDNEYFLLLKDRIEKLEDKIEENQLAEEHARTQE